MKINNQTAAICGLFCGICHHAAVIEDFQYMKEHGAEELVSKKTFLLIYLLTQYRRQACTIQEV